MPDMFIISFDNGESYDDHHISPLCVVPTKKGADAQVAEWLNWAEQMASELPESPDWADHEMALKRMEPSDTARNAIVVPHDIEELRDLIASCYGSKGYLTITQLPCLK